MKRKRIRSINGTLFLACIVALGVYSTRAISIPQGDISHFLNGSLFRTMETMYQKNFPLKEAAIGFWAALEYTLFHEGRNGVVVGRDDWLFSSEEYIFPADYQTIWKKNLQSIVRQAHAFEQNGTKIVVALVPEKVDLYRTMLKTNSNHNRIDLYGKSLTFLDHQGVHVINLRAPLLNAVRRGKQIFFRTDTHWTILGARLAAKTIAASGLIPAGTTNFVASPAGQTTHAGDLTNFIPTGRLFARFGPPPEERAKVDIYKKESPAGLFGDLEIDTALIGTSYSADERWRFVEWLQYFLHREIVNYADKGTGPFAPMRKFVDELNRENGTIHFVIWEIPVRYLLQPSNGMHTTTNNKEKK